jgi:hypothetical protein
MEDIWGFLFTGFGAFIVLISLTVVVGAAVLVRWTRKID